VSRDPEDVLVARPCKDEARTGRAGTPVLQNDAGPSAASLKAGTSSTAQEVG